MMTKTHNEKNFGGVNHYKSFFDYNSLMNFFFFVVLAGGLITMLAIGN
ncbi:MAG: hypothetical protein PHD51_03810 [Patescibacteria group bacterium]|nr:hypothetical protein [Patescibacteria group bacterium]MDD5490903.1 hypothetical protein [Patescibacteria group bacterium]